MDEETRISRKKVNESIEDLCMTIYKEEERTLGLKELFLHMEKIFNKPMFSGREKYWAPVLRQIQKRITRRNSRRQVKATEIARGLLGNDPRFKESEDVRKATARVVYRWITSGELNIRSQKSVESLVLMFNEIRWVYNLKAEEIPLDTKKLPVRLAGFLGGRP
ncbi:MAG: hypothetical protein M0036_14255 [Desulfobacteraceae bacterium]|nr:hypothetical protein [Desulfobacteraceae bacterium]